MRCRSTCLKASDSWLRVTPRWLCCRTPPLFSAPAASAVPASDAADCVCGRRAVAPWPSKLAALADVRSDGRPGTRTGTPLALIHERIALSPPPSSPPPPPHAALAVRTGTSLALSHDRSADSPAVARASPIASSSSLSSRRVRTGTSLACIHEHMADSPASSVASRSSRAPRPLRDFRSSRLSAPLVRKGTPLVSIHERIAASPPIRPATAATAPSSHAECGRAA
eukprot:1363026-Pleurochrysis_carterae.AAC.1